MTAGKEGDVTGSGFADCAFTLDVQKFSLPLWKMSITYIHLYKVSNKSISGEGARVTCDVSSHAIFGSQAIHTLEPFIS